MNDTLYERAGAAHRSFLGWRHAPLAGMAVIVGPSIPMAALVRRESPALSFPAPSLTSASRIALWMINGRMRGLHQGATSAWRDLDADEKGFSTESRDVSVPTNSSPSSRITHAEVPDGIFWASSVGLSALSVVMLCTQTVQQTSP